MPSDGRVVFQVSATSWPPYQIMPMPKARMTRSEIMRSTRLPPRRQDVEQHVEAHVVVLAHADGGAEKDEPAHQHDRAGLGPARRVVEHVAAEHLPGDECRHQHQPDAGEPQRQRVERWTWTRQPLQGQASIRACPSCLSHPDSLRSQDIGGAARARRPCHGLLNGPDGRDHGLQLLVRDVLFVDRASSRR